MADRIMSNADRIVTNADRIVTNSNSDRGNKTITKVKKNNTWTLHIGRQFAGKCYTGCGAEITVLNFECGHIIAASRGGNTAQENLRPICSTCNKSMGSKNMVEYINEQGFKSSPMFDKKDEVDRIHINNVFLPLEIPVESELRIPEFETIGGRRVISGYRYLVDLPASTELLPTIKPELNGKIITINELIDGKDKYKVKPTIRMIGYICKNNKRPHVSVMKILNSLNFDVVNDDELIMSKFEALKNCKLIRPLYCDDIKDCDLEGDYSGYEKIYRGKESAKDNLIKIMFDEGLF